MKGRPPGRYRPARRSPSPRVLLLLGLLSLLQACAWFRAKEPATPAAPPTEVTCLPEQDCPERAESLRDTSACRVAIDQYRAFVIDPMEDDPERRFRIYVPQLKRSFELRRDQWFVAQDPRTLGMQTPVLVEVAVSRQPERCASYVNALRLVD